MSSSSSSAFRRSTPPPPSLPHPPLPRIQVSTVKRELTVAKLHILSLRYLHKDNRTIQRRGQSVDPEQKKRGKVTPGPSSKFWIRLFLCDEIFATFHPSCPLHMPISHILSLSLLAYASRPSLTHPNWQN